MSRSEPLRVVQLADGATRRVALVDEPSLRLLDGVATVYELARTAIAVAPMETQTTMPG